jgi:hypothetical protein
VGKASAGSAARAGTTPDSDAVAAGAVATGADAAFLAPPQQELAASGTTALALAASLGSVAAVVEQQDDDLATEVATGDVNAEEAMDAVTTA